MPLKYINGQLKWIPDTPWAGVVTHSLEAQAAPKPPAPAAPAPPQQFAPSAPAPVSPDAGWQDSTYTGSLAGIENNLGNVQSYLTNQGKTLGLNYGINYQGDPIHGASGFQIDPNVDVTNPFSRAALLKRSYTQSQAGNTTSYAAQGQLYSGALQNAQNQAGFQNQQGQDALLKDFSSQFGGLYQQWLQAQQAADQARIDAQNAALARNEPASAADPSFPGPYQTPAGYQVPNALTAGPAITDPATGRVYQPAPGVAVAPGWMIVNGQLVKTG